MSKELKMKEVHNEIDNLLKAVIELSGFGHVTINVYQGEVVNVKAEASKNFPIEK